MTQSRPVLQQAVIESSGMIACQQCDLLQQEINLPAHSSAYCIRCRALLYRGPQVSLERMLALTLGSIILLIVSNLFPIAVLTAQGASNSTTLFGMVLAFFQQGKPLVAVLVLATTILVPALQLSALLYMLLPLYAGRIPVGLPLAFRLFHRAHPWNMIDVLLLGLLITLIKLADLAKVVPGVSLWAFVGLIAFFSVIYASFSTRDFWRWVTLADPAYHLPKMA